MDFDFDGDEFAFNGASSSKAETKKSTMKRKKRTFGQRSHSATYGNSSSNAKSSKDNKDDANSSLSSFSSSIRSITSISAETTNGRRSRRRIRRRQDYSNDDNDDGFDDDFDDDLRSTQSHSTSESTDRSYSVSSIRSTSRTELSVRRGTGAFCSQDAGTYQMVHDEVTYLCSTILSKTTLPLKAIDSALELTNLLSSRKTRSMLWQDRSSRSSRSSRSNDQDSETDSQKSKKPAPIPKVWSSILQVLALAATTTGTSSENQFSSNSSIGSSNGQTKPRTKSARRKEKAWLGASQTTNSSNNNNHETKLNADMKTILACILYYVSWDCTLSAKHSIAVLGAVQKPQVARRIRWAILERGSVLTSAMKLMVHSQPSCAKQISSKIVPTRTTTTTAATTTTTGNSVSPLQTRKRSSTKSKAANGISISTTSKPAGDPTAMGRRRKRKNRKNNLDTESMPPPAPRGDELSFADSSKVNDDHSSIVSSQASVPTRISKKMEELRAKIYIESSSSSETLESQIVTANKYGIKGDCPWLSIVCLEALQRILMGKELDGKTSSLEGEEKEENDDDSSSDNDEDPKENVVMVTNRLVGKSGMIPLLSHAWSQTMVVATKIVFGSNESKDDDDEVYWVYCYDRLKLIAHLIDEACFFSERNRTSFCQDDPFDFSSNQNKGLIFYALSFLHLCSKSVLNQPNSKRSETMALALRTLTSLTHENHLAAKQMKDLVDVDFPTGLEEDTSDSIQGLAVLANLIFQLQESKPTKKSGSKRTSDHELHRYDGTVFSLTTLANVIEDSGSGRILMELELAKSKSGKSVSWIKWLCQWVVQQTETFRHDILSIGNNKTDTKKHKSPEKNKGLNSDEEGKLLAAGNGCIVLACLICKSDGDDPESSHRIRKLIEDQMPPKADGSSSELSLVVNTMKAHCNYYHMTMGQMSVAVVAPVKKLIRELEEIIGAG